MNSLQDMCFSLQDVSEGQRDPIDFLHYLYLQSEVSERVTNSRSGHRWWNRENCQLPNSIAELI